MTREEAVERIKMILEEATANEDAVSYVTSDDTDALDMAIKAIERQKPMEKFENVKDHILKLASDYKCWDNRLTDDEALELCHILEQEPILDKIRMEIIDTGAYEQEVHGKTEFLEGINYCLSIIDKYKAEMESEE